MRAARPASLSPRYLSVYFSLSLLSQTENRGVANSLLHRARKVYHCPTTTPNLIVPNILDIELIKID